MAAGLRPDGPYSPSRSLAAGTGRPRPPASDARSVSPHRNRVDHSPGRRRQDGRADPEGHLHDDRGASHLDLLNRSSRSQRSVRPARRRHAEIGDALGTPERPRDPRSALRRRPTLLFLARHDRLDGRRGAGIPHPDRRRASGRFPSTILWLASSARTARARAPNVSRQAARMRTVATSSPTSSVALIIRTGCRTDSRI